jgi:uncharacterized protein (AIM24 family)
MVGMSHTIMLEGNIKFSFKKMITGSEMSESTYRGKGEVLLAPSALGDIVPIRITGDAVWSVGKDAFLACTEGLKKDSKSQGISKAIFSGEGLFVFKFTAADNAKKEGGILWVTSLGAIVLKELKAGEQFFIDNNHLVAWDTKYTVERVASGGVLSGMAASEGVACRFTGRWLCVCALIEIEDGANAVICRSREGFLPDAKSGGLWTVDPGAFHAGPSIRSRVAGFWIIFVRAFVFFFSQVVISRIYGLPSFSLPKSSRMRINITMLRTPRTTCKPLFNSSPSHKAPPSPKQ